MNMRTGTKRSTKGESTTDPGVTLVEVIVSIALTGGVVLAILGALFTVVRSSSQNANATDLQAVVGGAADQLAGVEWEPCPDGSPSYLGAARSAAGRVGWDAAAVSIVDVDYWSAGAGGWVEDCSGAASLGTVETLQRITLRVTSPDGISTKSFDVVKSSTTPFAAGVT